jgi:hypothetical protein
MTQEMEYGSALERAAVVATLIQGEVLAVADACVVIGDAAAPLSAEVADTAAELGMAEGLVVAPYVVDDVVLITQTCDLQETTAEERTCQVAPVVRVDPQIARQALRGRRPRYVALPWRDDQSVADLSLVTTVERSVLVGAESLGRPETSQERLRFADAVARHLTRPALPDAVVEVLVPFLTRIKDKHDKNSDEGRCLDKVAEFRLEAVPDIDAESPALTVLALLDEADLPPIPPGADLDDERIDALVQQGIARAAKAALETSDPVRKREAWTALTELWVQPAVDKAAQTEDVGSVEANVLNGDELSYARSRNTPVLDLQYLSTRPS